MVRRPLGAFCLGVSLLILLILELTKMPQMEGWQDGQMEAEVTGRVYRREERWQNGQSSQVLYVEVSDAKEAVTVQSGQTGEGVKDLEIAGRHRLLCYLKPGQEEARIGSTVRLKGKLSCFEKASNPGQFDSYSYYQISKISFRLSQAELLAKTTTYNTVREGFYQLRAFLAEQLAEALPIEDAGIMQTMLLGERAMLDGEIKALYQRNGIAHILAISGVHISLLGMGLYRLLRRGGIPMKASAGIGAVFLAGYGMMTGFSVSVVRAVIMFAFQMAAVLLERSYDRLTALGVAGVLLLLWQPLYWYHSGFVFSFGCVLGIALLLPVLTQEKGASGAGKGRPCKEGWLKAVRSKLLSGCALAAITFPIYLNFYYQFPVYSVLLNLLVLPLMSLLLAAGILLIVLQICCPALAALPALLIHGILWFYQWLCRMAEHLPGKLFTPGMPGNWQKTIAAVIILLMLCFHKRLKLWLRWAFLAAAMAILMWHPKGGLTVTFLDVGQGDCICVENGNGKSYLVDGGSSSVSGVGQYRIIPFLKYQGIGELEAVFVSHSDQDHCSGILELLTMAPRQGIKIKNLVLPDLSEESRDETYGELEEAAQEAGIPVSYIGAGQRIQDGRLRLRCLHPEKGAAFVDANIGSMVLELTYGEFRVLLTGDIEGEGERLLIDKLRTEQQKERVAVLKAAHHGSKNSTSEDFLKAANPFSTIISCGKGNPYGHPHKETLERLEEYESKIYQTDEGGAITVQMQGETLSIETYKPLN